VSLKTLLASLAADLGPLVADCITPSRSMTVATSTACTLDAAHSTVGHSQRVCSIPLANMR